ncbi:hypothetical protein GCM10011507_17330 [Edaphobacter acidisoli]|uniref:Glycosyltransferase RgtA/B/C/D-like domain-containing protein n=1 Tax=Edaphobacter acidisoli TaxID=2040573 RepID=A0A916RT75_9BACT|nr:glycosyltransferase family 39 protein [Edaphobacter acidisoli]GGA66339.1 hypothetical protein GCM10011507_17330 [Edaphobacter acidisoli]
MKRLRNARKPLGDIPPWKLYPLFFAVVYFSHLTLLRLPYFWDEAGYYIPAAWDFYRTGSLIPQTTLTNAHPPLPSILLAAWWHLSGFVPSGTRTLVCMVSAAALLGVFKLARSLCTRSVAAVTAILTAIYPIWFAQSTLAHADIFAAAFTLWAFAFYLEPEPASSTRNQISVAFLFSLAALSKETAIVTPVALALWETFLLIRSSRAIPRREHTRWIIALLIPILPLAAWYAYHYHATGFIFGNPQFLRYNATANLGLHRIALSLWHRLLHLTVHMNLYVAVICAAAALFIPATPESPKGLQKPALQAIAVIFIANWIAFSILGGALLTRYLLPVYPLIILLCVTTWHRHLRRWWLLAALTAAAFLSGIWIYPPYPFAPEDNLAYRDMVVLHVEAVHIIEHRYPKAIVLTAWPATSELARPELGYTRTPIKTVAIDNFSFGEIEKAAADPGSYDTALIFSTKIDPRGINLARANRASDAKYFDYHQDLDPTEVAALLHGNIVWQAHRNAEWAAILRFPRIVNASLTPLSLPLR